MNAGELKVDQATTFVTIEDLTAMMDKELQSNTRIAASLNDDTDFGPSNHKKVARIMKSMGAVGTSADNALAESFNATLKREVLRDRKVFDSPISCRQEVFRWCMRCNTRRRHSWCNLLVPDDFEALTSATVIQVA